MPTALHLAPHPDDEVIGAPAALMALRDAGWRIVNLACGLGRPADHGRRLAELKDGCRRAGFELVVADPLPAIGASDDLASAERVLAEQLVRLLEGVDLVVSPSPHDGHHGHEVVARAALRALDDAPAVDAWWMWGLWSDLPVPSLYVPVTPARLEEIRHALAAHVGELERNDYADLVSSRARANAILGSERVFGFGSPRQPGEYAELLTAAVRVSGQWYLAEPRVLDAASPLNHLPLAALEWWLRSHSVRDRLGDNARRGQAAAPAR